MKVRLVGFRFTSILGTSVAEMVRYMMFFSASEGDERWAQRTGEGLVSCVFLDMLVWLGAEIMGFYLTFRYCRGGHGGGVRTACGFRRGNCEFNFQDFTLSIPVFEVWNI